MPTAPADRPRRPSAEQPEGGGIYVTLTLVIQAICGLGLVLFAWRGDWENVFLTVIVILLTLAPTLLWRRWGVFVPPEFQLVSAAFVFLSLFLGSAADLYYRYWWWDVVLHTSSGFLLAIIGFLAVFLLNGIDRMPVEMKPIFVCVFGVAFAVLLGVLWEIFEFAMDQFFPALNMQTTETGVNDTMWDLIVDTLGAVIVAAMGMAYFKTGRYSFIADGVRGFVNRNPHLFEKAKTWRRRRVEAGAPFDRP